MTYVPAAGGFGANTAIHPFSSGGAFQHYFMLHSLSNEVTTWPAANRAIYMPIYLPGPYTMTHFFWGNGSTITGNLDMGIYTEDGTKLFSTGSTAASGSTFTIQTVAAANTLPMGTYYIGMAANSAATSVYCRTYAAIELKWAALAQEASAFALPATATPATVASAFVPFAGIMAA